MFAEVFVCFVSVSRLFNLDCLLVYYNVRVVTKLESSRLKLETLEGVCNFVVNNNTGGLCGGNEVSKNVVSDPN
jgi:hypothetical protein